MAAQACASTARGRNTICTEACHRLGVKIFTDTFDLPIFNHCAKAWYREDVFFNKKYKILIDCHLLKIQRKILAV